MSRLRTAPRLVYSSPDGRIGGVTIQAVEVGDADQREGLFDQTVVSSPVGS
jgi:hypothetical protein